MIVTTTLGRKPERSCLNTSKYFITDNDAIPLSAILLQPSLRKWPMRLNSVSTFPGEVHSMIRATTMNVLLGPFPARYRPIDQRVKGKIHASEVKPQFL